MNLKKLFDVQKVLRDRIAYNEPDRFNKLVLALLVELAECANEWRGFKFWSKDQTPRTLKSRAPYMDLDDADFYNPLLEEYVDALHFVLEIGLELEFKEFNGLSKTCLQDPTEDIFVLIFETVSQIRFELFCKDIIYISIFSLYLQLGERLGFTWEQIEQAYLDKNKINHERQESGY